MNAPAALATVDTTELGDRLPVTPSLERRRLQSYLALMIGDIAAIVLGFSGFGVVYLGTGNWEVALRGAQLVVPLFLTIGLFNGTYSIESLQSTTRSVLRSALALVVSAIAIIFIAFMTRSTSDLSRAVYTGGSLVSMVFLVWLRLQMRAIVQWRCGDSVINELIIDDDGPALDFGQVRTIRAAECRLDPDLANPHALDRIGYVLRNIDRVIVSCPPERRQAWAMMLKGANVEGEVLADEVIRLGAQGARVAGAHGLLLVSAGPLRLRDRALKRLFDIALCGTAAVLLAPLLLLTAIAIKLEDRGPVFFVQRRMGRGNEFFNMYKFRSMSVSQSDADASVLTSKDDARVTRVGKFIRRTSIDELPQIFNVLLGHMSIVGPRPHAIGAHAGEKLYWEVDPRYWHRHSLKPGLSGLAQVRGFRGATDHESDLVNRLQSDLEYLEGWTIMRDVQIVFMTLRVLMHEQAF